MTGGEIALWALNQRLTEQDKYNALLLLNACASAKDDKETQSIIEAWCFKIRVEKAAKMFWLKCQNNLLLKNQAPSGVRPLVLRREAVRYG